MSIVRWNLSGLMRLTSNPPISAYVGSHPHHPSGCGNRKHNERLPGRVLRRRTNCIAANGNWYGRSWSTAATHRLAFWYAENT